MYPSINLTSTNMWYEVVDNNEYAHDIYVRVHYHNNEYYSQLEYMDPPIPELEEDQDWFPISHGPAPSEYCLHSFFDCAYPMHNLEDHISLSSMISN